MEEQSQITDFKNEDTIWTKIKMFLWKFTTSKQCPRCKKKLVELEKKQHYLCRRCGFGEK